MLQNASFLAKIGADTAENERNFAEKPSGEPSAASTLVACVQLFIVWARGSTLRKQVADQPAVQKHVI